MLNQQKDYLIEFLHLHEVEDNTICKNDRNVFFNINRKEKVNPQIRNL